MSLELTTVGLRETHSWVRLAAQFSAAPTEVPGGAGYTAMHYTYSWRPDAWRRVPGPYVAPQDTFFADAGLTVPIVSRG